MSEDSSLEWKDLSPIVLPLKSLSQNDLYRRRKLSKENNLDDSEFEFKNGKDEKFPDYDFCGDEGMENTKTEKNIKHQEKDLERYF